MKKLEFLEILEKAKTFVEFKKSPSFCKILKKLKFLVNSQLAQILSKLKNSSDF